MNVAEQTRDDFPGAGLPSSNTSNAQDDVLARVVQGAHHTIDRMAETAAPHVQRLQKSVSETGELLHERTDLAREVGDEWIDNLRGTVRDHPFAAVATALAVGVLIARITR